MNRSTMAGNKGRGKRKSDATLDGNSKKQAKTSSSVYSKDNVLCNLMKDSGVILMNGETPNEMDVSKAVFQKKLGVAIKRHQGDLMETIDTFLGEFTEFVEDTARFHKSLMPCVFSEKCENMHSTTPESIVRLLLGVEVIQSPFMTLLLEKLQEFIGQEEDYILYEGQRIHIPRLLLSQFRFLDRIVDGKELTRKILEVLSVTSTEVQTEIMACIPDIVEDSEHGEVTQRLRSELVNNPDLTCPVIDVLTCLNVSTDQMLEVRTTVLEMLKSFAIPDLPIVIKFLLESVTSKDAIEVVNEIRSSVVFTVSSKLPQEELDRIKTGIKMTIDALKGRMQFHRYVAEAWIKAIDAAKNSKTLDFFVLVILHWINSKKAVESLIRNKIRAGLFTEDMLLRIFKAHKMVLREYFQSILALAQALLRSPEPPISMTGRCLYKLAFVSFDSYCQQEVVGNLVTHVGSGCTGEIDSALGVLDDLVADQIKAMSRYAVYVKGVLDYLDHNNLSVMQIRKLYLLLARLAFRDQSENDSSYLQNDLHIIVRKQLTSGNLKYKRMGIMGTIAIIKALAAKPVEDGTSEKSVMDKERYKEVVDLIELVESSTQNHPDIAALFMDSLAGTMAVESLDSTVEEWIADHMTQVFEDTFVTETEEETAVSSAKMYSLNDEAESSIAVNILYSVEKMYRKSGSQEQGMTSPICLAPLFRLVTVCQYHLADGNLEEVDALLGSPVFMVDPDACENFKDLSKTEKDIACGSLFLTVNWFREVINSFAPMDTPEMKGKVMLRLKHVTELMALLQKCLPHNPSFAPPPAIFDADTTNEQTSAATKSKPLPGESKRKGGKKKGNAGKNGATSDVLTELSQPQGNGESSQRRISQMTLGESSTSSKKEESTCNLSEFKLFFRELDFSVFNILKAGRISHADLDSDLNTKDSEDLQIGLPELQFLLEDLSLKLSHSLTARGGKRQAYFKAKSEKSGGFSNLDLYSATQISQKTARLLPCLFDHLESTCSFFQHQMEANDGIIDGPGRFSEEGNQTAACYQLIMQSVLSFFSWNGFYSDVNSSLLKRALMVVVNRICPSQEQSATYVSLEDAKRHAFTYFANFVDTVPDVESAVCLIKILCVLAEEKAVKGMLGNISKTFLSREWRGEDGTKVKGAKFNESLQVIIKTYVEFSSDPLEALESIASQAMAPLIKMDKKGCSDEFPSLTKLTFPVYYKIVLAELITIVKKVPVGKKSDSLETQEDHLLTWSMAVRVLHISISFIKVFSNRSSLAAALKYGRQFVEIFLRAGMPLLDNTFRRHHTIVEKLLKSLQQSTRMMHHLCGHSKIVKDTALINQVPNLKRALEAFVYRVKAMLTLNKCQEAFWMGNLKNKNLQGEEILTQSLMSNDESDNEAEEEGDKGEEGSDDNQANGEVDSEDEESEVEMEDDENRPAANGSHDDGGSYSDAY